MTAPYNSIMLTTLYEQTNRIIGKIVKNWDIDVKSLF